MAFRVSVTQIEAAASRLRADRDRISGEVETLLDGGWSGTAASAYGSGWAEWRDGADQVVVGLEALVRLLRDVEVSFAERDHSAGGSAHRIRARLG